MEDRFALILGKSASSWVRSLDVLRVFPGCLALSHFGQFVKKNDRSFIFLLSETSMNKKLLATIGVAALVLATAGAAVATNYSLWINGRNNTNAQTGNYADFTGARLRRLLA